MHKTANSYSSPKHKYHAPLTQRFPEDIECIIQSPYRDCGSLYISNIQAAQNPATLQRYSVQAVLSCAKGYELNHSKSVVPHYLYIAAVDHQNCDIYPHFDQAVNFIQKHLKTTNVLVHCLAGVSRSVSMVIAYFIRQHNMTDLQAFNYVKSRRRIVNPNEGFRQQLKKYHREVSSSYKNRLAKTPPKRIAQQYRLYIEMPLKHLKTSSTNQKSLQGQNKDIYGYLNSSNKSSFIQYYKQSKVQLGPNEQYSIDKHKRNFEDNSTKYYSLSKIQSYREINIESQPKQQKTKGYYQSLREDLDQRIEKIKQKYDVHRQRLQQRYQKRNILNTSFEVNYTPKSIKQQNELRSSRVQRLKTQSFHQYNKQPNYIESQRQKDQKLYQKIDSLFPKRFHLEPSQKSIQKSTSYLNNTSLLNNYQRVKSYRPKNDDFLRPTTYANFKNRSRY